MTYTLAIATPEGRDLVVTALRQASDQRTRVARGAARKVAEAKAARRDVRSQAVKVTDLLAEADVLAELAATLEAQPEVAIVTTAPGLTTVPTTVPTTEPEPTAAGADDDGLSAEAHRLAALAGLEDAVTDTDDPTLDTGAIAEDDADEPVEVLP